jgi:repressor LexA
MKSITNRQREVLDYIKRYISRHKFPPTIREISCEFEISVKGAYDHVKALEKKQYIKLNNHRSRTIEVLDQDEEIHSDVALIDIPVLGNVAAGKPLFAEENFDGTVKLPSEYLRNGHRHFALHVRGDSMSGVGILDGDIGVFAHQVVAENGDIVVAMVDEAVTLKRFYKEKNRIKLKAENPDYPSIFSQDVRILGKLALLMRDYG